MMLSVKTVNATGTDEITAEIPEEADRVKAFLWEKEDSVALQSSNLFSCSLNPQCAAWELIKNEQGE